ncbi:hypothetical protein J0J30_14915 [Vibrio vulnificus]|nr:hypothetical protein [Vibrio vulnificus]
MAYHWSCTNSSFTNDSVIALTKVIWARVPKSPIYLKRAIQASLFQIARFKSLDSNRSIQITELNG